MLFLLLCLDFLLLFCNFLIFLLLSLKLYKSSLFFLLLTALLFLEGACLELCGSFLAFLDEFDVLGVCCAHSSDIFCFL